MGEVVNLADHRPHMAGPARCAQCRHEWSAVAEAGTVVLECPSCGLMKGCWVGLTIPSNTEVWACRCGNDLFMLRRRGAPLCVLCGLAADSWVES